MNVRGTSAEERRHARRKRTAVRRALFYRSRLQEASSPYEQLGHACDYAAAVGDDLQPGQVVTFAREVAELADRWNKP